MDGFLGEIRLFAFNYAPKDWASCNGSSFPLAQCQALSVLLASTYGPITSTNVVLPDMRGRAIVGALPTSATKPADPSVSAYALGQQVGTPSVALALENGASPVPSHSHTLVAKVATVPPYSNLSPEPSDTSFIGRMMRVNPSNRLSSGVIDRAYGPAVSGVSAAHLHPSTLSPVGATGANGSPHENRQPYLVMNYCICVSGTFPSPS